MITFILADLRALIDTAGRKSGRTVEEVMAVCPRTIWLADSGGGYGVSCAQAVEFGAPRAPLDLTDPATAHMLVPLLVLCHGLDPGPGGRACFWCRMSGGVSYRLGTLSGDVFFTSYDWLHDGTNHIYAPTIATEPDDLAALVAAYKLAIKETAP